MPFRQLLNLFKYGILAVDNRQNIVFCNKTFLTLLEIKQNLSGKSWKEVFKDNSLTRVLQAGQPQLLKKFIFNNKMFLVNRIPVWEEGKVLGALSIFKEITAIERITTEIAKTIKKAVGVDAVVDAINHGILFLDKEGTVCKVNSSLLRDTGLTAGDFLKKDMGTLFKQGLIKCNSIALTSLNKKRIVTDFQKICTGKELAINAVPVINKNGEVLTVASTVKDITDFNKVQLELKEAFWLPNLFRANVTGGSSREKKLKKEKLFITGDTAMLKLLELAKKVAATQSNILILGESGVGKEIIVEKIHKWSLRQGKLIKINCSAIPEQLLESELFGYEAGAFTGANKQGKPGAFEMADRGTLFLDEIGDLPLAMQAKLLRILEDTKILRLGGVNPVGIDTRIIAATNHDLKNKTQKGEFRADLFYRLHVLPVTVPPLRARTRDIPLLLSFYLGKYNKKYQLQKNFSPATVNLLMKYSWPGNVRELKNVVERMVIVCDGDTLQKSDLPGNIIAEVEATATAKSNAVAGEAEPAESHDPRVNTTFKFNYANMNLKKAREELEKIILENAIRKYGSFRKASRHLGISHTAVIRKARNYKLEIDK
ncbi:MAG: sigma 54-interacting transcriptional regulator [Firmicutes bacterium]|nr:sigma 54-interacting transcriptional regulator [Bacillota bacterium]